MSGRSGFGPPGAGRRAVDAIASVPGANNGGDGALDRDIGTVSANELVGSCSLERHAVPFVREGLSSKSLHFSLDEVQSRMLLKQSRVLDLLYTRTMMGFLLFKPAPSDILMVGLGGGSLAKFCFEHLPKTRIDVVEINLRVIALREQFDIPADSARFRVIEADAAAFMRETPTACDVLLLDGFGPNGLPRQLATQRFYDDCVDALRPGGVLVANLHTAALDFDRCVERIGRSFGTDALVVPDAESVNSIVFAGKGSGLRPASPAISVERRGGLDKVAREQLSDAFERVASALDKEQIAVRRHAGS